jgi:hypothetical protein
MKELLFSFSLLFLVPYFFFVLLVLFSLNFAPKLKIEKGKKAKKFCLGSLSSKCTVWREFLGEKGWLLIFL